MTVNKIIETISKTLYNEFGSKYYYYRENIKQGFKTPCFYIKVVEPYIEQGLNTDKKRVNKFVIQFINNENCQNKKEIYNIYEKLIYILDFINIDGKLYKGEKVKSIIEDNVLHFFINYNYHVKAINIENYMRELKQKGGVKNV